MPITEVRTALKKAAMKMSRKKNQAALIEELAAIEHDQWIAWSKDLEAKEFLSLERVGRWRTLWIPYDLLTEEYKEEDRKWARKVLEVIYQKCSKK